MREVCEADMTVVAFLVLKDVAVDRKQICCSKLEPVVDRLYECEGDGLLGCGCSRKRWNGIKK